MSDPRRYTEREIAAIFEKATQAQEQARQRIGPREGLTLQELQEIGREAGIAPDFVAHAASALTREVSIAPPRTLVGMPVGVERNVDLAGPLSDEAWDRLVVDLRETFQATGEVRREGSIRQWRNGHLHAYVEPTATGYRLRLRTYKGSAQQTLALSGMALVIGVLFLALLSAKATPETGMLVIMSLFVAVGLTGIGHAAYSLPRWAAERGRQMEVVIARTIEREAAAPVADSARHVQRIDLDSAEDPSSTPPTSVAVRTRA